MTQLEQINANADLAVATAQERLGVKLTFDRHGAEWLDGHLDRLRGHLSAEAQAGVVNVMGSFLGECVVRAHGGEWFENEHGEWLVRVRREYSIAVNVFGKVEKQLNSADGESVLSLFDYALEVARTGGGFVNAHNTPLQPTGAAGIVSRIRRWLGRGPGR
jgi:hypothetical protein